MNELLVPPNVEPAIVTILEEPEPFEQGGPWVATEYPTEEWQEVNGVIRVSATGGARPISRVVVAPTVLVECWHDDEDDAWRIAATAYAKLGAAAGRVVNGVSVNFVSSTLPNNNPDVNRKRMVRYQFMAEVWTRLVSLEEV